MAVLIKSHASCTLKRVAHNFDFLKLYKNVPPAVSTEKLRKRFRVEVKAESDADLVNVSHIFSPSLDDLLENDEFIECLLRDVTALCSMTTVRIEKIKKPATTSHLVSHIYCLLNFLL